MKNELIFIKQENEHIEGGSTQKEYFKYICHEPDSACQIEPTVCRIVDKFSIADEPVWEVDETECKQCIKANSRVLEDIYNA